MNKGPLLFKKLSIQKLPGIPLPGLDYTDLSPNINIIAGPNASGKSSTARIIQDLIWKGKCDDVIADGLVEINKVLWQINMDHGKFRSQREGIDDELTGLPPGETSGRYMLALHELIRADEAGLAKQVVKESIGGFDLEYAGKKLGYSSAVRLTTIKEYQEYLNSITKFRETDHKHEELRQDEERLEVLRKDRVSALEALQNKEFYDCVREYLIEKLKFEKIYAAEKEFPRILESLTGEESGTIGELEKEVQEASGQKEAAEILIGRYQEKLHGLDMPPEGINPDILPELKTRVVAIEKLETEINAARRKESEVQARAGEVLNAIGKGLSTDSWKGITLQDAGGLDEFIHNFHQALSEKQFIESRLSILEKQFAGAECSDPDDLRSAISTLGNWLHEERSIKGIAPFWVPVLTIAGIALAILTWLAGPDALLFLPLLIVLGLYPLAKRPSMENNMRRRDYEKTGAKDIMHWTVEEVTGTMGGLMEQYQEVLHAGQLKGECERLRESLEGVKERLERLHRKGDEWREILKSVPDVPVEELKTYSGLYWYLKNVYDWQRNQADARAIAAGLDELSVQLTYNLDKFNEICRKNKAGLARDAISARAVCDILWKKIDSCKENTNAINRQKDILSLTQIQIKKADSRLREIYDRMGVTPGNKQRVEWLTGQLSRFRSIRQELFTVRQSLLEKELVLHKFPGYPQSGDLPETLTLDSVNAMINDYSNEAGRLESINTTITRIETKIDSARQGHDLEDNLVMIDKARSGLEMVFEQNLASITGHLLAEHLKEDIKYRNRPRVFERANQIFTRITGGLFKLIVDDKGKASFRGYNNIMETGLDLDELSTGTRIQLLLAVRLAFIESQESFLAIPLLADELLANSDDTRARAIIEALVEISKEGRQVFYFTAQADEVDKWRNVIGERKDISCRIIDIGSFDKQPVNGKMINSRSVTSLPFFEFAANVPRPGNRNYEQYRELLMIPEYDILSGKTARMHLWFLLDDTGLLYNCLASGISYWGQLLTYLDHGGKIDNLDEASVVKLKHKVKFIKRFQELYSSGRPKPIDREVLSASGAVSASFIDQVTRKLEELDNNPGKLVNALARGEVPRFLQSKTAELRDYLMSMGYLDDNEPLGKDEIIILLNALVSTLSINRHESGAFINRVLGKVEI
jgi:hypothetical protein